MYMHVLFWTIARRASPSGPSCASPGLLHPIAPLKFLLFEGFRPRPSPQILWSPHSLLSCHRHIYHLVALSSSPSDLKVVGPWGSSWNTGVSVSVLGEAVPLNCEYAGLAEGCACWWRGLLQLNYALPELKYQIMAGKEKDLKEKEGNFGMELYLHIKPPDVAVFHKMGF